MTIVPALLLGGVAYVIYEYITYHPAYKESDWTIYIGLLCVIFANLMWIFLTKNTLDSSILLKYSMYWGFMVTILSIIIPMVCFEAKFSGTQAAGMTMAIAGLLIMRGF